MEVSACLSDNVAEMQRLFARDRTLVQRDIAPLGAPQVHVALFFCDGMIDNTRINEAIVRPLTLLASDCTDAMALVRGVVQINEMKPCSHFDTLLHSMLYGDTILFCAGSAQALILNTKGFSQRSIAEPPDENVLKGPREGFSEGILLNLSLLRRKIRTTHLKFEYLTLGTETKTTCCLCYIDGIVDLRALHAVRARMEEISLDSILGASYVSECLYSDLSPFRTINSTERPDVVAAKLLEGRVAVLVDGSPVALTFPCVFVECFQTAEDYYTSVAFTAIARCLRMLGFFLAISVVPLYLAMLMYHAELIPEPLLISIAQARRGVPFPTLVEAIALLVVFELLRESGARTTAAFGNTLSIVGGLVLGTAAVEARFVSAPMVIIVAFSGIAGLMTPKLKASVITVRFLLIALAVAAGIYGYLAGLFLLLLHLATRSSFGVPYLTASAEDSMLRVSWRSMQRSGRFVARRRNRT